jgi:cytochrome c
MEFNVFELSRKTESFFDALRFDSFEFAKIAGGVLCALLVIVGYRTAVEISRMSRPHQPPGYTLPMPEAASAPGHGVAPADGKPAPADAKGAPAGFDAAAVAAASASANAQAGATIFKKTQACHSGEKDGPNKVGPDLWGVVGRPKASHAGFNYSDAMKAKGGNWTPEDLAGFLHNPKQFVPGTKMLFPGVPDAGDLGDLLAYLNTLK